MPNVLSKFTAQNGAETNKKNNVSYNPFLNTSGELVNKFLNYQTALDNPNVSQRAKAFIQQATGLTPSEKTTTESISSNVSPQAKREQGNSNGSSLVETAKKYLGTQYVWGGASPKGFDCSGLMQYTYSQHGISIPRTAREQFKSGTPVSSNELQPGDLVFFKGSKGSTDAPGHVGMYVGNGQYIQAPRTGDVVKISDLSGRKDYVGARRYS